MWSERRETERHHRPKCGSMHKLVGQWFDEVRARDLRLGSMRVGSDDVERLNARRGNKIEAKTEEAEPRRVKWVWTKGVPR